MVAGPNWNGDTPPGVSKVFRAETPWCTHWFALSCFRRLIWRTSRALQAQYKAQPLSSFLGTPAPAAAPRSTSRLTMRPAPTCVGFFEYLNFLLQFAPTHPNDAALRERFARIGIEPGKPFNSEALPPQTRQALLDGIADANKSLVEFQKAKLDTHELSSADLFGTREVLGDHYDYRFAGAKLWHLWQFCIGGRLQELLRRRRRQSTRWRRARLRDPFRQGSTTTHQWVLVHNDV